MKYRILAIASAALLSGCTYGGIYAQHISDPIHGRPFESRYDSAGEPREGIVNAVGLELRRDMGRVSVTQALSYDFAECQLCLGGGPWRYEARVGIRLFGKSP